MEVRKLDTEGDKSLLREASGWASEYPDWYVKAGHEDHINNDEENIHIGIFDGHHVLFALYTFVNRNTEVDVHLVVKRGATLEGLIEPSKRLLDELIEKGVRKITALVYGKNLGVKRLCEEVGLKHVGSSQGWSEYRYGQDENKDDSAGQ
jgi:hypothetical protein